MAEQLKRRIGLGLLTTYGVGVMVGAGIYVLIGAVAGEAGSLAPLAFVLAGVIAAPTALSYAEFSTRIPEAAGEAAFALKGFGSEAMALVVGLAIVLAGIVSAAAVLRGGVGYLTSILAVPSNAAILLIGLALTAVAVFGVFESLALAAVFTFLEIVGLLLVVIAGSVAPPVESWTAPEAVAWTGIGAGAVLAFFAFIGFEDIVNMAEEVPNPERVLPRAILLSLAITSLLYGAVAFAAARAVSSAVLAGSEQPLALVWTAGFGGGAATLSAIAVFAALNGVLAQIVMASRVLFGLGRRSSALSLFHHAHPRFGTPALATALIGSAVIIGAVALPVATLAGATSATLLIVFMIVNAALIALKRRAPGRAAFEVPLAVPVLGFVFSGAALLLSLVEVL